MDETSITGQPPPPRPGVPEGAQTPVAESVELPPRKPGKKMLVPLLLVASHLLALVVGAVPGFLLAWALARRDGAEPQSSPRKVDSLAILPFTAGADLPENARHSVEVGIPDALAAAIVAKSSPGLKVIATQVIRERALKAPPQQSGRLLQVTAVLAGEVKGRDLTLQLIAVESGELLWSQTFGMRDENFPIQGGALRFANPDSQSTIVDAVSNKLGRQKK